MNEKRDIRTGATVAILVVVVLLPLLYFLSLGPLNWLYGTGAVREGWLYQLVWCYATPSRLICQSGYGEWLLTYLEWWRPA